MKSKPSGRVSDDVEEALSFMLADSPSILSPDDAVPWLLFVEISGAVAAAVAVTTVSTSLLLSLDCQSRATLYG